MPRDEMYSSSGSEASNEQDWLNDSNDEDGEQETLQVISLCDDQIFPDAASMLAYCKDKYLLDFLAIRNRLQLDFHGTVKLINFIRQRVHEAYPVPAEITEEHLQDDALLKPFLEDDALILCLDDLPEPPASSTEAEQAAVAGLSSEDLVKRNAELQRELDTLAQQFNRYRLAVQQTLDTRWAEGDAEATTDGPSNSNKAAVQDASSDPAKPDNDYSESYFASYARNEIHETMLKDHVRTDAYRDFVYQNKHLFEGKVVLDIGCGTGILSMFCAKAGAKQVIAVDKSEIVNKAREIIFDNGLDGNIVCLSGRIEEVTLPVKEVDIIISEWMGYCLLYEAMLNSVLWARDKYLKPDGLLVPSHANMWISPITNPGYFPDEYITDHVDFWRDVYGFDMKAMQANIYDDVRVDVLPPDCLGASPCAFEMLDLHTVKTEDLVFDRPWKTTLSGESKCVYGFLLWFDMFFAPSRHDTTVGDAMTAEEWSAGGPQRTAFTTGPFGHPTHWKQGVVINKDYAEDSQAVAPRSELHGTVSFTIPESYTRGLNIGITWEIPDKKSKKTETWMLH